LESLSPTEASAQALFPKKVDSDEHFGRSFAFFRKWKAILKTKERKKQ
jgi:hypothetical protein